MDFLMGLFHYLRKLFSRLSDASLTALILDFLGDTERSSYEIFSYCDDVAAVSIGRLYAHMLRMEREGLVESRPVKLAGDRHRRYYRRKRVIPRCPSCGARCLTILGQFENEEPGVLCLGCREELKNRIVN